MLRAITFIELLTTITILVIALYFISPIFFQIQSHIILQQEIAHIRSFIYQVYNKAKYSNQSYSINISQQKDSSYCIIAIEKESSHQIKCDCFNIKSCNIKKEFLLYQNHYKKVTLISKSLYPEHFMNIDGRANRLESKCLGLKTDYDNTVLQFDPNGVIDVIQKNKRSECRAK